MSFLRSIFTSDPDQFIMNRLVGWLSAKSRPHLDRLSELTVNARPLPTWSNVWLLGLMAVVWVYAIGLNWWADSKIFTVGGLAVIVALFAGVFVRTEAEPS